MQKKGKMKITMILGNFLLCLLFGRISAEELTCSVTPDEEALDPNLHEMTYNVGDGEKKFMAYVDPDISTFYQGNPPASTKVTPKFEGLAGKFINMSNQYLRLMWEPHEGGQASVIRHYTPFSSGGSGTFPGHRFFFTPEDDPNNRLQSYIVEDYPENIYYYDPYYVEGDEAQTEKNLKVLNKDERAQYDTWRKTLIFNEQYRNFTGRSYLSNYLRKPPGHFMWRADYFGQEHWVTTRETHFETVPPLDELDPIMVRGEKRVLADSDPRILQENRVKDQQVMNMTLKVLSCAPRVFEIQNFLSEAEVNHIVELAAGIDLKESTTGDVGSNKDGSLAVSKEENKVKTRTSFNSWVPREQSPVIDAIYRRSADLLRIDEALLRFRGKTEYPNMPTNKPVCESLQLVHYGVTQEYTAHHDFGYSKINDEHNGARFATLLFYLNEGMVGGETSFPRWMNAETFEQLKVKPEAGKAVLFYSVLPDGNMDDFSQHAALPVKEGEKWLINLWVWDPIYE